MKFYASLFFLYCLPFSSTDAQGEKQDSFPFTSTTAYVGNSVTNFLGGKRIGSIYLGLLNWKLESNIGNIIGSGNGIFRITFANSHGGQPSSDFVGDYQGVSNIEAGTHTFLYELLYRQSIGKFTVTVGLQDMNAAFASSECATLFMNSSFGIPSTISSNFPAPIYPLTALGVVSEWSFTKDFTLKAALFDGKPDDFEHSEYNLNWHISKSDGYLAISELSSFSSFAGLPGNRKIGAYYHESRALTTEDPECALSNYGAYAFIEQTILQNSDNEERLTFFTQISIAPKSKNSNNAFFSAGLHYKGVFSDRKGDIIGLALASAGLRNSPVKEETAIEINYLAVVNNHFYLKPDAQLIVHPAGEERKLANALVGSLQFGFTF